MSELGKVAVLELAMARAEARIAELEAAKLHPTRGEMAAARARIAELEAERDIARGERDSAKTYATELEIRIAELEAACVNWGKRHDALQEMYRKCSRERQEAEAEVARLREALERIRREHLSTPAGQIAREAEAEGGQEPNPVTIRRGWSGEHGIEATNPLYTSGEQADPEAERGVSAGGDYQPNPVYPRGLDGTDGLEDGHWLYA